MWKVASRRHFAGFGVNTPLVEQRAVLSTLARLEVANACAVLKQFVLWKSLPESLLPATLQAAAQAGLSLPAGFLGPLPEHEDAAVSVSVCAGTQGRRSRRSSFVCRA